MSIKPYYMYPPRTEIDSSPIPLESTTRRPDGSPALPSLESLKKAIASTVGINNWQSTGKVEEAKQRIIECVLKKQVILDLSGLGLSPLSKDMLKHLDFLQTFICDEINDTSDTLPDYFLEREWTILFITSSDNNKLRSL